MESFEEAHQATHHINKLRILSIGSNAISAFFSWRLQASQAAEVTIVWRSHFDSVQQYGIAFRSDVYGSDRFRPTRVVRTVEEAAADNTGFDYVFVCVKALPDVYDLGEVIQSVVTPAHTCIILNTTTSIGVEAALMKSYPRNMVLSLCSGIELSQTGPVDFDHTISKMVYVGAIRENPSLPLEAQQDMIESLTLTLEAGAVDCQSTTNIEKYQWEKLIGMIAFQPVSVLLQEPDHTILMDRPSVKELINTLFDECLAVAEARSCSFSYDFKLRSIAAQLNTKDTKSAMYQDYLAKRPLELEVFLATPIRLAQEREISVPTLKSIHALLSHVNAVNQTTTSAPQSPAPRSNPQFGGQVNQRPPQMRSASEGRTMSMMQGSSYSNGVPRQHNPQTRRHPQLSRTNSLEGLEEFASVAMYGDMLSNGDAQYRRHESPVNGHAPIYEQPSRSQRPANQRAATTNGYGSQNGRGYEQTPRQGAYGAISSKMNKMRMSSRNRRRDMDEDDEDDDFIEPVAQRGPPINPDHVDMLAMTRKSRNSAMSGRLDTDRSASFATARPTYRQARSSQALLNDFPSIHDSVTQSALFGMGDNRYGTVDSRSLAKQAQNGRLNSMQSERMMSMSNTNYGNGNGNGYAPRQQGPPNALQTRGNYSTPSQYRGGPQYANSVNGYRQAMPPPIHSQRQPVPAHVAAYQGKLPGNEPGNTRSVTGSASASFGSLGNGSGSHSSSSSRDDLPPVPPHK